MKFLNEPELPEISIDQQNAIEKLKTGNIIIDSVAGCGKTTTNMYIGKEFNTSNILLLTYNSKLKLETRIKVQEFCINNIEVHSYHSFCVKNYDNECFTDEKIIKLLKKNTQSLHIFNYDIIILDEAQDINPTFYELICKIYADNKNNAKLCILGDKNQSIYDFNDADSRYITYADIIFNFNGLTWDKCQLPFSFRITYEMSEFINMCMMNNPRIYSKKISNIKPSYIYCNIFYDPYYYIKKYLKEFGGHYDYNDIFILGASVKKCRTNIETPIRRLANALSNDNIPIFVPNSDDEKLDESILNNKIVFSTFHQSKGLERKIVFIIGFDNSYYEMYNKNNNIDKNTCPNILYVATTRAYEKLILFHAYNKKHLPFIKQQYLETYCDLTNLNEFLKQKKMITQHKSKPISVTELIRHLPEIKVIDWVSRITIKQRRKIKEKIDIPYKTQQIYGYETVSEITGTMIPAYYEFLLTGQMTIFNDNNKKNMIKTQTECQRIKNKKQAEKKSIDNENMENAQFLGLCNDDSEDDSESFDEFITPDLNTLHLKQASIPELLYITNLYDSNITSYKFKPIQFNNYNWLSDENLQLSINRLKSLKINKSAIHERKIEYGYGLFDQHPYNISVISGIIDCINVKSVYEFKCVSKLNNEHYLQLILYMCMYEKFKEQENITTKNKYYLYNIRTDELQELISDLQTLEKIVKEIIEHKYTEFNLDNDKIFIQKQILISEKYYDIFKVASLTAD